MQKYLRSIVVFFLVGFVLPFYVIAGEFQINSGRSEVKYTPASVQQLSFTSQVSLLRFRDFVTKKGTFTELFIDGHGKSSTIGDPDLPTYRKLIEVPAGAEFEVILNSQQYKDYKLADLGIENAIIPVQPSVSKAITDPDQIPFVINEKTYLLNKWLGEPLVTVTYVGTMRDVHIASIEVSPVQYNPVSKSIRIYEKIDATVVFKNADLASTILQKKKFYSPYFGGLCDQFVNYDPPTDSMIMFAPVTYVIVSPPMFKPTLQPFIHWKTQKGFKIIEAYTDNPDVGTTATSIKNYLHNLYHNPPAGYNPQSFVLIVGDVAQIPASSNSGQATDLRYCEYTGDNIPEAFYGRFSAINTVQLQSYIDKTMEYEKYLFPDDTFLGECVMVAGYDAGGNGLTYGNGQINYGTENYFDSIHNLLSHTYLQPEHTGDNYSQNIRNNVSNGVCYANYTAHGGVDGWSDPSFNISHIAALQNAHKYPLMVGNCCVTSSFNQNCFAEEITRAVNKGALGYIGASNNSLWNEDYWRGVGFKSVSVHPPYNSQHLGAYDVTFHDKGQPVEKWFVTQGQMVVGGNMAVQESNSSSKKYYWEIYNLMGDPSLSIYFSIPPALTASYPENIAQTETSLTVLSEPWSYVALSVNDSILLDAKLVDSTGTTTLMFDSIPATNQVRIVITKQNRKPIIDSLFVGAFAVTLTIDPQTVCRGDTSQLTVQVSGGSGNYTYHWTPVTYLNDSTIATPYAVALENITYTVTVDDGDNTVTSSPKAITVNERPETPVITLAGDSLVSNTPEGNQWYADGVPVPGETGSSITPTFSGNYYVIVSDSSFECSSLPSNVIPYYMTFIPDLNTLDMVQIYPVPTKDYLNIFCRLPESGILRIRLLDAFGKEVRILYNQTDIQAGNHSIVVSSSDLAAGIYYCQIQTKSYSIVKKVLVNR